MAQKSTSDNTVPGSLSQRYMAAVEQELYLKGSCSTEELRVRVAQCESLDIPDKDIKVSSRTIQNVIKNLKKAYKDIHKISPKDAIRVTRVNGNAKYVLGEQARMHLLYPENIFYDKTDRDKLNLLLRVGEYFSLPMEAFMSRQKQLQADAKEFFGQTIELRFRPYDSKVFACVFEAVENHKVISFQYKPQQPPQTSSTTNELVITPYYLKTYANKWYLIGHIHKSQKRWTVFALDRIADIKICENIEPYSMDVQEIERFYENVIGFHVAPNPDGSFPRSADELDVKDITILMKDKAVAYYLEKNPIHKSQERSKENELEFHIMCVDNIHLYQALLRMLDDIQWIEPKIIRDRLLSKLVAAQNRLKPQ